MLWDLSDVLSYSFALFAIIIVLVYYYGTLSYDYWKTRGVPYLKPTFPFLGTSYEVAFSLKPNHVRQFEIYSQFKKEKFVGVYSFTKPVLYIYDPSLIENILVKDFSTFYNRSNNDVNIKLNPLTATLASLKGAQWKSLRQKLTPVFSSCKLKGMHPQLVECSDTLVKCIDNNYLGKSEPIEVRELMAKFTIDVIGSCVFGLNTQALEDPNSEFRKIGRKAFELSVITRLIFELRSTYPWLFKFSIWAVNDKESYQFLTSFMKQTISHREQNNVIRNDFVQLSMELKKQEMEKQKNGLTGDDPLIIDDLIITASAFVFFVGGFETTTCTLAYCLYELALHPDIQEEAYQHVVDVLNKHGGEITFDVVEEMTYIHQIISETLRMHPPTTELRRVATKDYMMPGTTLMLPKGSIVAIPTYSLHYNPEYFPEPEKFKPERFNKENGNIKKGTYLPFGDGPRICIAKRFSIMELHVALVKLLLNYKFTLNSKTKSPLDFEKTSTLMVPAGGIWMDLQKRS